MSQELEMRLSALQRRLVSIECDREYLSAKQNKSLEDQQELINLEKESSHLRYQLHKPFEFCRSA